MVSWEQRKFTALAEVGSRPQSSLQPSASAQDLPGAQAGIRQEYVPLTVVKSRREERRLLHKSTNLTTN